MVLKLGGEQVAKRTFIEKCLIRVGGESGGGRDGPGREVGGGWEKRGAEGGGGGGGGALLCSSRPPWSKMLIKQIHILIIYVIYTYVYIISQVSGFFFKCKEYNINIHYDIVWAKTRGCIHTFECLILINTNIEGDILILIYRF